MQSPDVRMVTEAAQAVKINAATAPLKAVDVAHDQRLDDLEVLGGLNPGNVNDATTASLIRNQESDTHSELSAAFVGKGDMTLSAGDYGASPAATAAENTTAINAAANAGGAFSRATVTIPPGVYPVSGIIDLPGNVSLLGYGATLDSKHGGDVIRVRGTSSARVNNVLVEGITILSSATASSARGVFVEYADNVKISGVSLHRPGNNGLDIRESTRVSIVGSDISADDYGIFMYRCQDFTITGNNIYDVMLGINLKGSLSNSTLEEVGGTITGNTIRRYKDHGISGAGLADEGILRGVTITGNTIRDWRTDTENVSGSAIEAGTMARGYVVQGNTIIDPGTSGISLAGNSHTIVGNSIEWHKTTAGVASAIPVTPGTIVIGNTIRKCHWGIYAPGIIGATISGNSIENPTQYGIYLNNNTTPNSQVIVTGNRVSGGTRGIYEAGLDGVDNTIQGNIVSGASIANVTIIPTSTWQGMNRGAALPAIAVAAGSDATVINALTAALRKSGIVA